MNIKIINKFTQFGKTSQNIMQALAAAIAMYS